MIFGASGKALPTVLVVVKPNGKESTTLQEQTICFAIKDVWVNTFEHWIWTMIPRINLFNLWSQQNRIGCQRFSDIQERSVYLVWISFLMITPIIDRCQKRAKCHVTLCLISFCEPHECQTLFYWPRSTLVKKQRQKLLLWLICTYFKIIQIVFSSLFWCIILAWGFWQCNAILVNKGKPNNRR